MAKIVQVRRGTTAALSSVTGAEGELFVDTDKETLTVHNNYQAGGFPLLREDLNNMAAASVGIDKISIGSATAGQALKVNDAGTALEFGVGGRIISYNNYRFTGIYQAPTTTAETTYWTVQFNRTRSDSQIWVVSDIPAFELPNGVWIGVALNVNSFKSSRGLKHFRPNTDTTTVGFNALISASEVGTTTGNITIAHFYNWGGASSGVKPFSYLNFSGGSGTPGNTDPRISSSYQTEGHMMVMEIV